MLPVRRSQIYRDLVITLRGCIEGFTYSYTSVRRAGDEVYVVKLDSSDGACVADQASLHHTAAQIP